MSLFLFQFDIEQYRMVKEALHERANLLQIAPHLAYPLPIMLPVYKYTEILYFVMYCIAIDRFISFYRWYLVPYYWAGIKAYDFVGKLNLL